MFLEETEGSSTIATSQNYKAVRRKHHQNIAKRWCMAPQMRIVPAQEEKVMWIHQQLSQCQHSNKLSHNRDWAPLSIYTAQRLDFSQATLWAKYQCLKYKGCKATENSTTCDGQRARAAILDLNTGLSESQWCLRNGKQRADSFGFNKVYLLRLVEMQMCYLFTHSKLWAPYRDRAQKWKHSQKQEKTTHILKPCLFHQSCLQGDYCPVKAISILSSRKRDKRCSQADFK